MEWTDSAIILDARRHGENSVILDALTNAHGRHKGLVRGAFTKRARGVVQPGNLVRLSWRARLAEHLGQFQVEMQEGYAARLMATPIPLALFSSAAAITCTTLAEREPHGAIFDGFVALIKVLGDDLDWTVATAAYIRWELELLRELGFGLDLSQCAATGTRENLSYVSPRTGRAVSRAAGLPYHDRLLTLPEFLLGGRNDLVDAGDLAAGLALTGYFIHDHLLGATELKLPPARNRLGEMIEKKLQDVVVDRI